MRYSNNFLLLNYCITTLVLWRFSVVQFHEDVEPGARRNGSLISRSFLMFPSFTRTFKINCALNVLKHKKWKRYFMYYHLTIDDAMSLIIVVTVPSKQGFHHSILLHKLQIEVTNFSPFPDKDKCPCIGVSIQFVLRGNYYDSTSRTLAFDSSQL